MRLSYSGWTALIFALGCGGETASKSPEARITSLCEEATRLPCRPWETQSECETQLREGRNRAAADGCADKYDELVRCAEANPLTCTDGRETPTISPLCDGAQDAVNDCTDDDVDPPPPAGSGGAGGGSQVCSHGVGSGAGGAGGVSCFQQCTGFAVTCEGANSSEPVTCTCTEGPQTGRMFVAGDCGVELNTAAAAQCANP
jgi:hypothetical protein